MEITNRYAMAPANTRSVRPCHHCSEVSDGTIQSAAVEVVTFEDGTKDVRQFHMGCFPNRER